MSGTRDPKTGHFLSNEQLENPRGNLSLGPKVKRERATAKRNSEREYLRAIIENFTPQDAVEIVKTIKAKAREGDKDAWNFLGRYVFGNGKVSLDDVVSPPMIRKSR